MVHVPFVLPFGVVLKIKEENVMNQAILEDIYMLIHSILIQRM
jgi:hypothetical protein